MIQRSSFCLDVEGMNSDEKVKMFVGQESDPKDGCRCEEVERWIDV
jgi:hypothetical protein